MKKFIPFLLSLICASGFFFGNAITAARAENAQPFTGNRTLTGNELDLLLPGGYEQYLALRDVNDISVKDGYIAIADGNSIYVYNGAEYRQYTAETDVRQLEWGENHTLYFKYEGTPDLYTINCNEDVLTAERSDIRADNSFTLNGNDVYGAYCENGKITVYKNGGQYYELSTSGNPPAPPMVYADDRLYFMDGLYLHHTGNRDFVCYLNGSDVYDIAVQGDALYYTDGQTLYSYNLNTQTERAVYSDEGISYTALSLDGNYLYVAGETDENTKIRRFDTATETFTDYEITTSSSAENRLISAKASIVGGNYLITADEGRLSLYDYTAKSYFSFPCAFTPEYIASDGENILIADGSRMYVYDFSGNLLFSDSGSVNNIAGVACTKGGDYFIVTQNDRYYALNARSFGLSASFDKSVNGDPVAVASDIYGNLYVEYSDHTVYKYTREGFLSVNGGETYYAFPDSAANIAVDFDGNVYGVSGNTLYCSDGNSYATDASGCLFGVDATAAPRDFAFGYEHGTVYFVYEDYILSTEAIDLPNLNNLETNNAYETVFRSDGHADEIVSVASLNESAVLLHFSLEELTESTEVFPYLTYSRVGANVNAVILGETEIRGSEYYIVSVFSSSSHRYTAGLILKRDCAPLNENDYSSVPERFKNSAGYVTNDVLLYKYPLLNQALTLTELGKNSVLCVLRELSLSDNLIDYDYYYVSYTDNAGNTVYGYVPKNFIRDFNGVIGQTSSVYYKTLKSREDVVAVSANNETFTLKADTEYSVIVYGAEEENSNAVRISFERDGVTYYANVSADSLNDGSPDLLRYFLIVLLLTLEVIIIVNYVVFRPKE